MGPRFSGTDQSSYDQTTPAVSVYRILTGVATPPDWTVVDGALERTFELPTFAEAIAFVSRVAELADAENHHPDIGVSYKKVTLRWTTHSEGGITDRDEDLARRSADLA
jgi:4a-hydroxytetrahydrobiopterin dehydratase